jgi:hypothetical protein
MSLKLWKGESSTIPFTKDYSSKRAADLLWISELRRDWFVEYVPGVGDVFFS